MTQCCGSSPSSTCVGSASLPLPYIHRHIKTIYSCKPQVNVQNYMALLHKLTFTFKRALTICRGNLYLSLRCCLAWKSVPSSFLSFFSIFDLTRQESWRVVGRISKGWSKSEETGVFFSKDCLKTLPRQIPAATGVNEVRKCTEESVKNNEHF